MKKILAAIIAVSFIALAAFQFPGETTIKETLEVTVIDNVLITDYPEIETSKNVYDFDSESEL